MEDSKNLSKICKKNSINRLILYAYMVYYKQFKKDEDKKMNKKELIEKVKTNCEIKAADAEKYVNEVFSVITGALSEGETVTVTGFGKFEVKERSARKGHNPLTGEEIDIPAKKVANFKAEKKLKDAVSK